MSSAHRLPSGGLVDRARPISFSFDQTRSATGPATFDVLMSTDGGSTFSTVLAGYSVVQIGRAHV